MKNWMKSVALFAALFGITAGAVAADAAKPAKEFKIAMIAKSSTNPVFLSGRAGAEFAAGELSKKYAAELAKMNYSKIVIDWRTPPNEDAQLQAQRIAQSVNDGVDAILLSCSDAGKVNGAINDAVARDIPVFTFDSDAPQSKRFAFYGVDDIETGRQTMSEMAKAIDGKGKVAILSGSQNAPNLKKRVEGAQTEAKKYPGIEIVGVFNCVETPQDAAAEVVRVTNAHPEITAWAMVGGWPLFTKTLLKDIDSNKIKIVSVDALPAQLPYIEKGLTPTLLAQSCFLWGSIGVEKIVDKVILKKDVPVMNKQELVVVNKDTLGKWARQLKEWKFDDVPEEYLKLP
jgi:ribose transport system substrate-binding protein